MTLATSQTNAIESLVVITILASVHVFVKVLSRLSSAARNAVLSAGTGASLAYVLMSILPKLAEKQDSLTRSVDTGLRGFLEHHVYLVAMAGLVVYYGIARVTTYGSRDARAAPPSRYRTVLTVAVVGNSAYGLLIGYLIVNRLKLGLFSLVLIFLGMGTLFLVTDHSLREKWTAAYDSWIRWVLASALFAGWALGVWVEVTDNVVALWFAFLAGLMLITTIKEKVSIDEGGSFWFFLAGVVAFTVLLLKFEQIPA